MASFPLTDQIKQTLYAGWNDQNAIQGDWNNTGDSKYESYISKGGTPLSTDPSAVSIEQSAKQKVAQQNYKQATDTAISGLQQRQKDLPAQYADLLKTVKGEYDPLINQTTATAGAELSKRGLTPDSTLFQQQTQGALQPVYGAEAANAQQIGQGSISDINSLASGIAGLQTGVAGTASQLPLQYGSLGLSAQALPSQIQSALAQAKAYTSQANNLAVPQGGLIFQPGNNNYVSPIQSVLKQLGINLIP